MDKNKILWPIAIVMLIAFLVFTVHVKKEGDVKNQTLIKDSIEKLDIKRNDEDITALPGIYVDKNKSKNWLEEYPDAQVIISDDDFDKKYLQLKASKDMVTYHLKKDYITQEGESLYLVFTANADEASQIKINAGNQMASETIIYNINSQESSYILPIKGENRFNYIKFVNENSNSNIKIGDVSVISFKENGINDANIGSFIDNDTYSIVNLRDKKKAINTVDIQDCVSDGKYLYVGKTNSIEIYSLKNQENPQKISEIYGVGTVRRIIDCPEKNILCVASREYGVFVLDITDKSNIRIASHIDTLELASGIDLAGNYLFIASRYYGIEVYDISDINNPEYVSSFKSNKTRERIDCIVIGDRLYSSAWGQAKLETYDISDISKPVFLGDIDTDGNPYGMAKYGDYLVVATGFHSRLNIYNHISEIGYGSGNGISIYDISNKDGMPELVSKIKTDGKYYSIGRDYWNVKISGDKVFYTDLYNGLFKYDISDINAPKLELKIINTYGIKEKGYEIIEGYNSLYSFDSLNYYNGCFTALSIVDGKLYVCDERKGIYVVEDADAIYEHRDYTQVGFSNNHNIYYDKDYTVEGYKVEKIELKGQTFSAANQNGKTYVGTSDGIVVFNEKMEQIDFFDTDGPVREIKLQGNRLYTAEGFAGIGIYSIGTKITKMGEYKPLEDNKAQYCYQIEVSQDNSYVFVATRLNMVKMFNIQDLSNIHRELNLEIGAVYYRNLRRVGNRVYVYHSNGISEISFGADGKYRYIELQNAKYYTSSANIAEVDENTALVIVYNGYIKLDMTNGLYSIKEDDFVHVDKQNLKGIPTVKDNLLLVTYTHEGKITLIDMEEETPRVLFDLYTDGVADQGIITSEDKIIVPMRYEGLVVIEKDDIDGEE